MSVQEKIPYVSYIANGSTVEFNIPFDLHNAGYLVVTVDKMIPDVGGYIVNLNDMSITFGTAPRSGAQVELYRDTKLKRDTNYQSYDNSFRPSSVNFDFDSIWQALQDQHMVDARIAARIREEIEQRRVADGLMQGQIEILNQVILSVFNDASSEYVANKLTELNSLIQTAAAAAAGANGWTASLVVDGDENQHQINKSLIRTVKTTNDLLLIQNPKNKQIIYVESVQKTFVYDSNLTTPENGVTVVGKWEMEIQEAYYASDLLPRSSIDNVAEPQDVAINKLYQYATSKGRAFIIDQPYYVESKRKGGGESYPALNPFNGGGVSHAIRIQSNSVLAFVGTGELKLVPSSLDFTAILLVHDVENYVILDPKCKGDKDSHLTTTGEQGICYHFGPSKNGYVRNPYAYNAWGDGFYFGFTFYVKPFINVIVPTNLVIDNPHGYNISRNGISLCGADNLTINSPYMEKVDRLAPKAGIDIEPEEDINFTNKMFIRNVKIHNATFVSCGYPYTHNIFGNREVDVTFTGTTKLVNKGSISSWIPMLLQSQLNAGQVFAAYQQQGSINFEHIQVNDIGSNLAFKYLMIVATPEKSVPVTIDKYEFISTNYEPEIALDQSNDYPRSSGLTVSEFVFRKQINQVKLGFETNVTRAIPPINYHLGIPDSIPIIYRGKGITFYGSCFIGGYDLLSGTLLNENQMINNVFIIPAPNPSDGNAIYGRVTINNNERKVKYSLTPALSADQIGYGLQVSGTGFFQASTTALASIELKQMSYPAGVQVYSSYGLWANP